jgi:hypothetical protein
MMGYDGTSLVSYVILADAYCLCSQGREMAADTVVLTVRIPAVLQQQLDTVAQAMAQSRAWVITQAMEHFVAVQAWQVEQIGAATP